MTKTKRLLVILPLLALLFGCKKRTDKNTNITTDKTTKKTVVTTKNNNSTNNSNSTTKQTTTKKKDSNICHYAFVNYDGTVLLENDVTKGTTISASIIPNPSRSSEGNYFYYFTGWDKEVNRTINDDVTYTAQYEKLVIPYEVDGYELYFGYYPQTEVTDVTITSSLNTTAKLPSTNSDWISYGYFEDNSKSDYMWYIDLDTNDDSRNDYRGVYFTKYRPTNTTYMADEAHSNVDDYGYEAGKVYWFKYEKIKWNILQDNDNSMILLASLTLDSQEFYPDHTNTPFSHNGSEGYVNTYKLSEIRKWLNNEFYNTAFNDTEKKIISLYDFSTREYTQSGSSKSSYCKDYIYLLSDTEINELIPSYGNRTTDTTEYAHIQGVASLAWSLRTPSNDSPSYSTTAIQYQYIDGYGHISNIGTDCIDVGVRPALIVKK